jgi:hypothetical protein
MKACIANKDGCLGLEVSVSLRRMTNEEYSGNYRCSVCGEENETFVDRSAGWIQSYVEDCSVCCRPNTLYVRIDESTGMISLETEFEG